IENLAYSITDKASQAMSLSDRSSLCFCRNLAGKAQQRRSTIPSEATFGPVQRDCTKVVNDLLFSQDRSGFFFKPSCKLIALTLARRYCWQNAIRNRQR